MKMGPNTVPVLIKAKDFENLSERAQAFIKDQGIEGVHNITKLSRSHLRRICAKGLSPHASSATAILLIMALRGYRKA